MAVRRRDQQRARSLEYPGLAASFYCDVAVVGCGYGGVSERDVASVGTYGYAAWCALFICHADLRVCVYYDGTCGPHIGISIAL